MGWYYSNGSTRKDLIRDLTECREQTNDQGVTVATVKIASCYRGGVFSGVLWTVWERIFTRNGEQVEPNQRWIACDLMRCDQGNWGYKPLDESMHPYQYSCPLGYLAKVPIEEYGGNAEWRDMVRNYHASQVAKRQQKRLLTR